MIGEMTVEMVAEETATTIIEEATDMMIDVTVGEEMTIEIEEIMAEVIEIDKVIEAVVLTIEIGMKAEITTDMMTETDLMIEIVEVAETKWANIVQLQLVDQEVCLATIEEMTTEDMTIETEEGKEETILAKNR